jgi:2-amino-4-hydroxy-6-hydroxymethyldihydropteridine diphosphokinase
MYTYYLHLGSNQGERLNNLNQATQLIENGIGKIMTFSSVYETEPWGLVDQPDFLNQAVCCTSVKSPAEVLKLAKDIESSFGPGKEVNWGPRLLDIDILYCDDLILVGEPTIPHPQIANRNFVLIPMMEIAGDFIDPVSEQTIDELYENCNDVSEVYLYDVEE